jgi:cell division protein FtsB
MLSYYWKSKVEAHATSKSYRNKPDLLDENRKLKAEIEKLEKLLHRKFLEQLISGTGNTYIQDKVAKISALEDRNRELERQVTRLSSQLRKTMRQID